MKPALKYFQAALIVLGVVLCIFGFTQKAYTLVMLGLFISLSSFATLKHILTGKYQYFSKYPKDWRAKKNSNS